MTHPVELSDLLEEVTAAINKTVTILDQQTTAAGIELEVCDVKYAEVGRTVTIGGNPYVIAEVDHDAETITVTGEDPITVSSFDLYAPHFFHGTPYDTAQEIDSIQDWAEKTPMVFLMEKVREKYREEESVYEREANAQIYFLTWADFSTMQTEQLMTRAVKTMGRLMQLFKAALEADERFDTDELEYDSMNQIKFGVFVSGKGVTKGFSATDLSGKQMDVKLMIYKDNCTTPSC